MTMVEISNELHERIELHATHRSLCHVRCAADATRLKMTMHRQSSIRFL